MATMSCHVITEAGSSSAVDRIDRARPGVPLNCKLFLSLGNLYIAGGVAICLAAVTSLACEAY